MIDEYFTIQHPPFFVSDKRASEIICKELNIDSLIDVCQSESAHIIERQTIAAYVLRLYTGLSLVQTAKVLNVAYGSLSHRLYDLERKINEERKSIAASIINNIINKL